MPLQMGDRVIQKGWTWRNESDRVGTVVEVYRGMPSATDRGVELLAVRWDDTGQTERGYILTSGRLRKVETSNDEIRQA
jgi:hypothetical protein